MGPWLSMTLRTSFLMRCDISGGHSTEIELFDLASCSAMLFWKHSFNLTSSSLSDLVALSCAKRVAASVHKQCMCCSSHMGHS